MESDCFFDARTCYENGLQLSSGESTGGDLKPVLIERIDAANRKLAVRNLHEAEHAYSRGDADKAIDHLELVKTLTYDPTLREKAEILLLNYSRSDDDQVERKNDSSCASCSSSSIGECADSTPLDDSLPPFVYYELLIQQLPPDQYPRYTELGEEFAGAYIAASRDEHHEALSRLENCFGTVPPDIYCMKKGRYCIVLEMILKLNSHFVQRLS